MIITNEASVLLTLSYVDQFNFVLNKSEIKKRLLGIKLSTSALEKTLTSLEKKGLVVHRGSWWKLASTLNTDWKTRSKRAAASRERWRESEKVVALIKWIPWLKGVGVTGSLAMNNTTPQSDIDFMIVASRNSLWLTRFLVILSIFWMGKRRTWKGKERGGWCFNLWLTENNLGLPKNKRNLYSAYEVCQVKWILDNQDVVKRFNSANQWVGDYMPNYFESIAVKTDNLVSRENDNFLRWLLNYLLFKLQYLLMYSHMSREQVELGSAYFHPRSTKKHIYWHWYNSLLRLWKN